MRIAYNVFVDEDLLMTEDKNENVSKLLNWIKKYLPEVNDDLHTGANKPMLTNLEEMLDVKFDAAFKSLYQSHNGQKNNVSTGFFYGMEFLSVDRIISQWKKSTFVLRPNAPELNLNQFAKSYRPLTVKPYYASTKWIPFAFDWGGNFLGLDFDPDSNGTIGQVINFGRDEDVKYVLAPSFAEFINWYAEELANGNFSITSEESGGRSFNTKIPPSGHFLDSIKEIFADERNHQYVQKPQVKSPTNAIYWYEITSILDKIQIASLNRTGEEELRNLILRIGTQEIFVSKDEEKFLIRDQSDLQTLINSYDPSIVISKISIR